MSKSERTHVAVCATVIFLFVSGCHFGDFIYGIETPSMSISIAPDDLEVYPDDDVILTGVLRYREADVRSLSFRLLEILEGDETGPLIEENEVVAFDGAFDEDEEEFELALEETPPEGDYLIEIFAVDIDELSDQMAFRQFVLHVVSS